MAMTGQAEEGENMDEMTKEEMQTVKMSTLYEIVELLDKIATAKDQQ